MAVLKGFPPSNWISTGGLLPIGLKVVWKEVQIPESKPDEEGEKDQEWKTQE